MAAEYSLNSYKDFEIIWIDRDTHLPKDMSNVTFELYHYEEAQPGEVVVSLQEPYLITQGVSDIIDIGSYSPAISGYIDVDVRINLQIIANELHSLGTPPNQFVVPGTGRKIAIVNGYLVAALSAAELAALINLGTHGVGASGYEASSHSGFLVLTGDFTGSDANIQVGIGTVNPILGLVAGNVYTGSDLQLVDDIPASTMDLVTPGRYVYPNVFLSSPQFKIEERYFVLYRSNDPITALPEISEENFTLVSIGGNELSYSFEGKSETHHHQRPSHYPGRHHRR